MNAKRNFSPINVSPFFTNVLDLVGREDLVTPYGSSVTVERSGNGFRITYAVIDGQRTMEAGDNISASFILNSVDGGVGTYVS
jgi:hypothetical protein